MSTCLNPSLPRAAFIIALMAVFVLALLPPPPLPDMLNAQDKAGHFMAFVGLGLLGLTAWPHHAKALVIALLIHGALIEVAQMLSALRQAELLDWLADAAGVATATVLWTLGRKGSSPARL